MGQEYRVKKARVGKGECQPPTVEANCKLAGPPPSLITTILVTSPAGEACPPHLTTSLAQCKPWMTSEDYALAIENLRDLWRCSFEGGVSSLTPPFLQGWCSSLPKHQGGPTRWKPLFGKHCQVGKWKNVLGPVT